MAAAPDLLQALAAREIVACQAQGIAVDPGQPKHSLATTDILMESSDLQQQFDLFL